MLKETGYRFNGIAKCILWAVEGDIHTNGEGTCMQMEGREKGRAFMKQKYLSGKTRWSRFG